MDSLVQFLRNPFSFNYDFDRNRRNQTVYYGYYKPTKLAHVPSTRNLQLRCKPKLARRSNVTDGTFAKHDAMF